MFKAEGVCQVYCGERVHQDVLSYAQQRAGYAPTKLQVLDNDRNVVDTILPETVRGLI